MKLLKKNLQKIGYIQKITPDSVKEQSQPGAHNSQGYQGCLKPLDLHNGLFSQIIDHGLTSVEGNVQNQDRSPNTFERKKSYHNIILLLLKNLLSR